MKNNLSENSGKALKYVLLGFVVLSVAAAAYRIIGGASCCSASKTAAFPAETAAPSAVAKPAVKATVAAVKKAAESKMAVVYYFYTNTRCSSCKTIEAYTREAVEKHFTSDYKGWKVVFKGVNVEEEPDKHFVQDYWLNSKSVVVQKFSGEKALNWSRLDKIWKLLGDKDAFMNYVADETRKLLDAK